MKLQSHVVNMGDEVYDLVEGRGTVVAVRNTNISVRFSGNTTYSYNSEGKRLGTVPARYPALLYWQNPIVMIPAKNEQQWASLCDVFKHAHKQLG